MFYIESLVNKLDGVIAIANNCPHMSEVFDLEWKKVILQEINNTISEKPFFSDKGLLFLNYKDSPQKLIDVESRLSSISSIPEFECKFIEKLHLIILNRFNPLMQESSI